jgi:3-isopropylmalate/(R)-2-methylmalate dehydratase small subunit
MQGKKMEKLKGRAWKFGDGISTDHIVPGRFFHLRSNLPELAKHIFADIRPEFISKMHNGDFIVGGNNFGQGSSREHAPMVIKMAGVSAIIAKSFARIFFRNCINVGIPALVIDTNNIDDGDYLEMDLVEGRLVDITKNEVHYFQPLPRLMANILLDGGLVEHIKRHGRFKIEE